MAIKKSELYSSLWKSCDELRGSMDASQYKDYVLVLLFIKYISDKYAGVKYAPITVPKGASFQDMVALKGKTTIGDDINKKIIGPIAEANKLSEMPDFNNTEKLGSGKDMVNKLSNLIAIFENPALDFSKNRAEGDDILGDAYEYLMRHFATESGKSKGQFYTPAEVSRVLARIVGINAVKTTPQTTVYDPTCGSGSLLLKVADEAHTEVSLFGQEMDNATAGLARMNMILHNNPTAIIMRENTLSTPRFLDNEQLKTFDFAVANPPFSFKSWSNGVDTDNDMYGRFKDFGVPPNKNGDYAFLLHIIRSLKSKGKGAVILPHGVLFRGNAEEDIRTNIIRRGYIKGIIGLPPNLFYGTGIPACVIVIDKENAQNRKGIFMIDASKGFMKDGNKNRLRAQDIHKIVDVFNKQLELPKYSRMVSVAEIEKNEFNLNIPRYIDSQEPEDIQYIEAHLKGDIPNEDIDALDAYWEVYPSLRSVLFKSGRMNHSKLSILKADIKSTIFAHPEFIEYGEKVNKVFKKWKDQHILKLKNIAVNDKPKQLIHEISEELLKAFSKLKLLDKYDVYEHLMVYWSEVMQDDVYSLVVDGWKSGNEVARLMKESKGKKGTSQKEVSGIEGLEGRLIPPKLLIQLYFSEEQKEIDGLTAKKEGVNSQLEELKEEHSGDEGLLSEVLDDKDNLSKTKVKARIKEIKNSPDDMEELELLEKCHSLFEQEADLKTQIKNKLKALEGKIIKKYPKITIEEIKKIVVEDKWMTKLESDVKTEMDRISQRLTSRIKELSERYDKTLPQLISKTEDLAEKVDGHLIKMGFKW
jgi:type I restriction enzyme M protein